jgi:hypothetical protein
VAAGSGRHLDFAMIERRRHPHLRLWLGLLCCAIGVGGSSCSREPRRLTALPPAHATEVGERSAELPRRVALPGAPRVTLHALEDQRPEGAPAGVIGWQMVAMPDALEAVDSWLRGELASRYVLIANSADGLESQGVIRPALRKFYVESKVSSKTAVLVLRLTFERPQGESVTRTYRGQTAYMNWTDSDASWRRAMRAAFDACWRQIEADLPHLLQRE